MAAVAFTTIRHGKDDGEVVVVNEGEEVKGLPADVVKDLKEQGLVGEPPKTQEEKDEDKEALQARVDELEAQLAEFEKTNKTPGK
jgi:hypothetical protein